MSPLAAPEMPPPVRNDFNDLLAEHPELASLQKLDETIGERQSTSESEIVDEVEQLPAEVPALIESEQPADYHEEVQQQLTQVRTNLTPPPAPAAPSPATPPVPPPTPAHPIPTVPGTPDTPRREPGNDEPLSVVVVDRSVDAKKMAHALAEQRLSKETHEGGLLKKAFNTLWRNGVAHEWYRQKYIRQAHEEIVHHQDVLHDTESTESARKRAEEYLFKRFELGDGYISKEVAGEDGEQHNILGDNSQLGKDLKDLIREAAQDRNMSADAITAKYDEIIKGHRDAGNSELFGTGEVTSHNIHTVIEKMRGIGLHGESLIHAVQQMRVISGESRSASRTEAHYNAADKAIEWLGKRNRLASIAPEAAVAAGVALAFGVAKIARGSLLKTVGVMAIPGVTGAVLGALRGRKIAKDELAQHERDSEFGKVFSETDKRRKRLEESMRDRKTALELIKSLQTTSKAETLEEGGDEALKAALKALAEVRVRQALYDEGEVVLQWSDETKRDEEAFYLTKAKVDAVNQINKRLESLNADDRARMRIAENATLNDILISDDYEPQVYRKLVANFEATDKERKKYITRQMLGHAALGGAASFGLSFAADIVADHVFSPGESSGLSQSALHDQGNGVKINGDYSMEPDRAGMQMDNYDLKGPDGKVVLDNLHRDPVTGKFDDASLTRLHDAGFEMKVDIQDAQVETKQVSIDDYINKHPSEFQKLDTQWMDNNTAQFDLNEQGGRFVANPDGTVTIGQNMTADGSFHGNMAIDMTDPARGQNVLDMAFKQPDGTFLHKTFNYGESIPKPWADMLYQKQDGTWGFKGDGHVSWGKSDGTTFYSAASIPGDGEHPMLTDTVEKVPVKTVYEITGPAESGNGNYVGGIVYTLGRSRLTAAERVPNEETPPPPPPYRSTYESMSEVARRHMQEDQMPELRQDPEARVALGAAVEWHSELTRRKDPEYADGIEKTVDSTPELANIDSKTKAIVTIPVGAMFEAENIHRTLMLYSKQDREAIDGTLLLLHVNWADSEQNDPNVIKTRQKIEQAKRDFPDLRIAVIETVWEKEKIDAGEYGDRIIGHVSQKMYDTAFAAVRRAINEGRMSADGDTLVIKNDADALGMDRRYLSKMIRAFEEHPENDTFSGGIRWGTNRHGDLPGLGFVTNFLEISRIAAQLKSVNGFQTSFGVNTAVRMSTFAAVGGIGHYTNQKQSAPDDLAINDRVALARRAISPHGPMSYGAISGSKGSHAYHRHVVGATIDSDASRLEKAYIDGKSIAAAWDKATKEDGSMTGRAAGLVEGQREDLRKDPSGTIERIEHNISELINRQWVANETQARAGLAFMLPGPNQLGGKLAYQFNERDGRTEFRFTPQGRRWVVDRLQRSMPKGKKVWDPYGARVARQLYGRMVKGARIQPKYPKSRMAGGI